MLLNSCNVCLIWDLARDKMADFCTAWRKGVRRVWNMPPDTHCYILPLLCKCLPVYYEVCRRSVNFLRTCISHSSCCCILVMYVWLKVDKIIVIIKQVKFFGPQSQCSSTVSISNLINNAVKIYSSILNLDLYDATTNTTQIPSAKVMFSKMKYVTACNCIFRDFIRMIQSNSCSVFSNDLISLKQNMQSFK